MKHLLIFLIFPLLVSCVNSQRKHKSKGKTDNFYTNPGSYDALRIPLIKPYELLKLNGSSEWVLNLVSIAGSVTNVLEVAVKDDTIFLHSGKSYCNYDLVSESWVVINAINNAETCFASDSLYNEAVRTRVNFQDPNSAYREFTAKGKVSW